MTSPKNTKRYKLSALLAGVSAGAILVSSGTVAIWNDAVKLDGGQIVSGNLDVERIGNTSWVSVDPKTSDERSIDLKTFKIVPGDTIRGITNLDVGLEGNNMKGSFNVTVTNPTNGDLIGMPNGVSVTYRIVDSQNNVIVPSTPFGSPSQTVNITQDKVTPSVDGNADFKVLMEAVFDANTPDRVRAQAIANLGNSSVTLKQVRSFVDGGLTLTGAVSAVSPTGTSVAAVRMRDTINYTYTAYNSSSQTMKNVSVVDKTLAAKGVSFGAPVDIPAGETKSLTASYTPQASDLLQGSIMGTSNIVGTSNNQTVTSNYFTSSVPTASPMVILDLQESHAITKDYGTYNEADPNDEVTFTYKVKNIGAIDAKNVQIDSSWLKRQYVSISPSSVPLLKPGETATFTATAKPTIDDLVTEQISNTSMAYAEPSECVAGYSCDLAVSNRVTSNIKAVLMKVLVADTYNRPNGALGATSTGGVPWQTLSGGAEVNNGQMARAAGQGAPLSVVETGTSDVDIQIKMDDYKRWNANGMIIRAKDSKNYLFLRVLYSGMALYAVNDGKLYEISAVQFSEQEIPSFANSYTLRIVAQGDAITAQLNGRTYLNALSTYNVNETKHGVYLESNKVDDFYVTNTVRGVSSMTSDDFQRPIQVGKLGTTAVGNAVWRVNGYFSINGGMASSDYWLTNNGTTINSWPARASVETYLRDAVVSTDTIGKDGMRGLALKTNRDLTSGYQVYLGKDNDLYIDEIRQTYNITLKKVPMAANVGDKSNIKAVVKDGVAKIYVDGKYATEFAVTVNPTSTQYGIYIDGVKSLSGPNVWLDNFKVIPAP